MMMIATKNETEKSNWSAGDLANSEKAPTHWSSSMFGISRNSKGPVWLDQSKRSGRGVVGCEFWMEGGARLSRAKLATVKILIFILRQMGENWEVFSREMTHDIYFNRILLDALLGRYCLGGGSLGSRVRRTEIRKNTSTIVYEERWQPKPE